MTRRFGDRSSSRRAFLCCTGSTGLALSAGCLGASGGDSGRTAYEPEALSEPPAGTPGEFHYVLEERVPDYELSVDSVYENDGDLLVAYNSDAENALSADELANASENDSHAGGGPLYTYSLTEAGVIAQAFNEVCVKHGTGTDYGLLIGEIANPLSNQPHGWGAKTGWFEAFNAGEISATDLQLSLGQNVVYEEDVTPTGDDA